VLQQKDNLCGPFWAARVLRDFGIEAWRGEPVDEDLLAIRADTLLPKEPDGSLPAGARSRMDYRFDLPKGPAAASGTSADALAAAIEAAAEGEVRCVPFRGRWTGDAVEALVQRATACGARVLANLRTGRLWGSRPPLEALVSELRGDPAEGPPPDWDIGHFCELALLVRGPESALVLVRDSNPSFGVNGHHLQPPRAVAAALERGDGREGGVLAIAPRSVASELQILASELELEVAIWDNGTRR
jgi:hypothetical protein